MCRCKLKLRKVSLRKLNRPSQILNMSDYTRFASKPTDQVLSQLVVVPVMGTLTCLIGIICTSTAAEFYPSEGLLWEPYNLLTVIQQNGGNGARAAVFFACESSDISANV